MNRTIQSAAGRATKNQESQPNSALNAGGKKFQPIKHVSPPVRKIKDIWLKPTKAAREIAAEPFERGANPAASDIAWLTGTATAARALPVGRRDPERNPALRRENRYVFWQWIGIHLSRRADKRWSRAVLPIAAAIPSAPTVKNQEFSANPRARLRWGQYPKRPRRAGA